jgi:hypothetical protein
MTASNLPEGAEQEFRVVWPSDANSRAQVSNMNAFQWDAERAGIYLLLGHIGPPIWLTTQQALEFMQDNPEPTLPVEALGTFYMNTAIATQFCKALASHLGLEIVEGGPGAS